MTHLQQNGYYIPASRFDAGLHIHIYCQKRPTSLKSKIIETFRMPHHASELQFTWSRFPRFF